MVPIDNKLEDGLRPIPSGQAGRYAGAELLSERVVDGEQAQAWLSASLTDEDWDSFLQGNLLGQFQQSSLWAVVKGEEGWSAIRLVIRQGEWILGGFQMLIRRRGFWREGFINKGPVCTSDHPDVARWIGELIPLIARRHRIDLVVTQAPDNDRKVDPILASHGHALSGLVPLITATVCIPLGPDHPPVQSRMKQATLKNVRQSQRRGVVVRESSASGIPTFFDLMCQSCRRQSSAPNPPTVAAALHLWQTFDAKDLARLTFAYCDGQPVAGLLALRFGNRVTAWKKGWSEEHANWHPNSYLSYDSILWAESVGACLYDFAGADRRLARMILAGEGADQRILSSRHHFDLGFGAVPQLLPRPRVWFRNGIARTAYRLALPVLIRSGKVEQ